MVKSGESSHESIGTHERERGYSDIVFHHLLFCLYSEGSLEETRDRLNHFYQPERSGFEEEDYVTAERDDHKASYRLQLFLKSDLYLFWRSTSGTT